MKKKIILVIWPGLRLYIINLYKTMIETHIHIWKCMCYIYMHQCHKYIHVCICVYVYILGEFGLFTPQIAIKDKEYLPEQSAPWKIQSWFFQPPEEGVLPRVTKTPSSHLQLKNALPVKHSMREKIHNPNNFRHERFTPIFHVSYRSLSKGEIEFIFIWLLK